ncbi:MAG TPA: hypothetical protein VKT77_23385, partial [Chthonomonadaceae bacterium]|nr:hypothetical protein [Chthonomonadaceae bacterium]
MTAVRTVGIFVALAALSFVLGFFVLARFMPGTPKAAAAAPTDAQQTPVITDNSNTTEIPSQPPQRHVAETPVTPPSPRATGPGPTLDPEGDAPAPAKTAGVQKPHHIADGAPKPDDSAGGTAARAGDQTGDASIDTGAIAKRHSGAPARRRRRHVAVATTDSATDTGASEESDPSGDSNTTDPSDVRVAKTRRPKHVRAPHPTTTDEEDNADSATVKPHRTRRPATRDDSNDQSDDSSDTARPGRRRAASDDSDDNPRLVRHRSSPDDSAATTRVARHRSKSNDSGKTTRLARRRSSQDGESGSGLYHVGLGAFHSRFAAVHEVERARRKGFGAQIVPVSRNGRTIYKVQAGA